MMRHSIQVVLLCAVMAVHVCAVAAEPDRPNIPPEWSATATSLLGSGTGYHMSYSEEVPGLMLYVSVCAMDVTVLLHLH